MIPRAGSLVTATKSATAWLTVLPQKSSCPTGSSGRSKRQAQYRVTGASVTFVIACFDWTALPTGEAIAAGHDQRGSVVPEPFSTMLAQPVRGSEGGQVVQGR